MEHSQLAWELLSKHTGTYSGQGRNHENQEFTGALSLNAAIPGKLLALSSSATGKKGQVYHSENSWIGYDISGTLTLYVSSSNHPGVTPHVFHRIEERDDAKSVVFRFGNPENRYSFREEVTFSIHADGSLTHHYSWGLPEGDFEPRSGSRMKKN